jgi:drug/metabolite transporter (DMT)-like permease
VTTTTTPARPHVRTNTFGLVAMGGAILCFSLGSTVVKKAGIPGTTMAFWRMLFTTSIWWLILWIAERRFITLADLRRALVPGIVFGLNITMFFSGVTRTSIANAEFIGALTPLIVVPAGAILYKEHINPRALMFGFVSLAGLMLVLFNVPANGAASWAGNLLVACACVLWATYLLTSRKLRGSMSVVAIMASIMPIAAITILPITAVRGELTAVTRESVPYIIGLGLMTGIVAHGLIVFAQRSVPVGTIGLLQVAQPALAVLWAYLLLDQTLLPIQLVGMGLVIVGLIAVVTLTHRSTPSLEAATTVDDG